LAIHEVSGNNLSVAPAPIFCAEKKALLERFAKAASDHLRMQTAQVRAMWNGDGRLFENEVKAAHDLLEQARRAIEAHEKLHGCP
jgi:hypothetical protein